MTVSKTSVQAVDLDDLERQLREIAVAAPATNKPEDPLAELARLVGRDKSLRGLQGVRDEMRRVAPLPTNVAKGSFTTLRPANAAAAQSETDLDGQVKYAVRPDVLDASPPEEADLAADQDESLIEDGTDLDAEVWEEQPYAEDADDGADETSAGFDGVEPVPAMPRKPAARAVGLGIVSPRALALALPALLVAVGVCAAVVWRAGSPLQAAGETPLIKADNTPVKVAPSSAAGGDQTPAEAALDAADPSTKPSQVVVARPEQPVDVVAAAKAAQTQAPVVQPPASSGIVIISGAGGAGAPASAVGGTPAPTGASPASAAPMPAVAANVPLPTPPQAAGQGSVFGTPHRVATVSVKPDGTFVSGGKPKVDASAPPAKPAPVVLADTATAAPPPAATGSVTPAAKKPADTTRAKPAASATGGDDTLATKPKPVKPPKVKVADATPPEPSASPPADSGVPLAITPSGRRGRQVASSTPLPTEAPAAEQTANEAGGAPFSIQVASSTSETEARATLARLQKQFPSALGSGTVHRADLGAKGVYYRVRVGPLSRDAADKICSQLKAGGAECILTRG
jgi:hypothetical protein